MSDTNGIEFDFDEFALKTLKSSLELFHKNDLGEKDYAIAYRNGMIAMEYLYKTRAKKAADAQ